MRWFHAGCLVVCQTRSLFQLGSRITSLGHSPSLVIVNPASRFRYIFCCRLFAFRINIACRNHIKERLRTKGEFILILVEQHVSLLTVNFPFAVTPFRSNNPNPPLLLTHRREIIRYFSKSPLREKKKPQTLPV